MRAALRKWRTLLAVHYAYMLEYRAEIFLWALTGILPFILMGVWMQAGEQGQFPLSSIQFAQYFLAVFVVRQFTGVWVIWEFEYEVVQGRLSPWLLQPLDPIWRYLARHGGERLARLPFLIVIVALFFLLYPQALWTPKSSVIDLGLAAIVDAFALRFAIQYTFAMLAFWTERAHATEDLFFLFFLFLSGYVAPLEVFPDIVRQITIFTPFPYMVYFPARLLLGQETHVLRGFAVTFVWTAVFILLNRWAWRKGLKRYSAMGA